MYITTGYKSVLAQRPRYQNHCPPGITMQVQLQPEFDEVLQPLGSHALEFFLAASLYHARKVSFASAAHMAGLDFDAFKTRLTEHFVQGYIIADECVLEDIHTIENL